MGLALGTAAVVLLVLLWELYHARLRSALTHALTQALSRARTRARRVAPREYDPGRELRAEQRARELLRSCVSAEEWAMYRDLGFLRVWGAQGVSGDGQACAAYAYLIYPHKPIVAYVPASGELLNEYCVAFPDHSKPFGSARLPDSDDVLAKWMALSGDERMLIADANMHLPGRQIDPQRVRRDLARLQRWERASATRAASAIGRPGSVRAA